MSAEMQGRYWALSPDEITRLFECVCDGDDEQSVLTRRLIAEAMIGRAMLIELGVLAPLAPIRTLLVR